MGYLNIDSKLDPKETTLNLEFSGRDFKKRISAFLAWVIFFPYIDPLRSSKNMYSPWYFSKLCSTLDSTSLSGMNEIKAAPGLVIICGYVKFA